MGVLSKFCKKVVDKFIDVLYSNHPKVATEEKCSYTLSSVFPSTEIQNQVYKVLEEQSKKQVS